MLVQEIMSKTVHRAFPEHTLEEAAQMMKKHDIGLLPVEENERLTGVVTDRDIVVRALAEGKHPATTRVRQVMSDENILYCYEDQEVDEIAKNMREQQVRRLIVLDDEKRLRGIVALADIAQQVDDPEVSHKALEGVSEETD